MNWNQKRKRGPQNVNAAHDGLSLRLYDRGEPHRHRRGVKIEENYLIPKITKSFFFSGVLLSSTFSKQHFLDAALDISNVRKLGAPRFKPEDAG